MTTSTDNDRIADRHAAQPDFEARHASKLAALMIERDDLRGLIPFADILDDAVRWSA